MATTTVLVHEWVTGGGLAGSTLPASWAAEGGAMRRAIARDFASLPDVRVVMTLDASLPDEPGPWTVARIGPGEESGRLEDLATRAQFTAPIAPETGGILAGLASRLERVRARSLGSTPLAIETAGDKLRTAQILGLLGIATPEARRIDPGDPWPPDVSYPAVLKPIDGAGSIDTFFLKDRDSIPQEARSIPGAVIQPYVDGIPSSASFLVGRAGAQLLAVGRQSIEIQDQRFVYRGGILPGPREMFDDSVRRAAESIPGLRGFVGVDYLWDERGHRPILLDLNPRPTTSYVGLVRVLPPGALARAWIEAVGGSHESRSDDLADIVHAQRPLTFMADGRIIETRPLEERVDP